MSEKLAIDEDVHELKFGRSFDADGTLSFHSMYCKRCMIPTGRINLVIKTYHSL